MAELRRRLHVQERGVESGQLLHRESLPRSPGAEPRRAGVVGLKASAEVARLIRSRAEWTAQRVTRARTAHMRAELHLPDRKQEGNAHGGIGLCPRLTERACGLSEQRVFHQTAVTPPSIRNAEPFTKRRVVAGEERDARGDLLGRAHPSVELALLHLLARRFGIGCVGEDLADPLGLHGPRADRVAPDAEVRVVGGDRARQADRRRAWTRSIRQPVLDPDDPGDGRRRSRSRRGRRRASPGRTARHVWNIAVRLTAMSRSQSSGFVSSSVAATPIPASFTSSSIGAEVARDGSVDLGEALGVQEIELIGPYARADSSERVLFRAQAERVAGRRARAASRRVQTLRGREADAGRGAGDDG